MSIPPVKAKFVIASWSYPDEYGQGISSIYVYENSTGAWLQASKEDYDESGVLEWDADIAIKLSVWAWFNSTLTGASDSDEGKLYQRHNVSVISMGSTVFSQQNFTYYDATTGLYPDLWWYIYEVVLDFLPEWGQTYVATITYEIFY